MKILILDGDRSILDALWYALKPTGHECIVCPSAYDGLNIFKSGHFDVILMDLDMPDMDGLSLLREIRNLDRETYVVIITADSNMNRLATAVPREVDALLQKPMDFRRLMEIINQVDTACSPKEARRPDRQFRTGHGAG